MKTRILSGIIDVAAAVFLRRAQIIEFAGGTLVAVAAWMVAPAMGVAVAGVGMLAKSLELDRRAKR